MVTGADAIFLLFCVAAYIDLRACVNRLHKRVSKWEHCHIKCKPLDADFFS